MSRFLTRGPLGNQELYQKPLTHPKPRVKTLGPLLVHQTGVYRVGGRKRALRSDRHAAKGHLEGQKRWQTSYLLPCASGSHEHETRTNTKRTRLGKKTGLMV